MQGQRTLFERFGVRGSAVVRIGFECGNSQHSWRANAAQRRSEELDFGQKLLDLAVRASHQDYASSGLFLDRRQNKRARASGKSGDNNCSVAGRYLGGEPLDLGALQEPVEDKLMKRGVQIPQPN